MAIRPHEVDDGVEGEEEAKLVNVVQMEGQMMPAAVGSSPVDDSSTEQPGVIDASPDESGRGGCLSFGDVPPCIPWSDTIELETELESSYPTIAPSPYAPSRQERAEHNIAHCPFRSWCAHCVAGKCKSTPHTAGRSDKDQDSVPCIGVDYAFMSDKGDPAGLSMGEVQIMAIKDDKSKYTFAIPVPQKGLDDQEWSVRKLIQSLEFLGYMRFSIKSDQESSVHSVVDKAKVYLGRIVEGWRPEQFNIENRPVKDSQSHGAIERGIQSIEGQVRTLISALQSRIGVRIHPDDCVL